MSSPYFPAVCFAFSLTTFTSFPEFSSPGASRPYTILPLRNDPAYNMLLSFATIVIAFSGQMREQRKQPSHEISEMIILPSSSDMASNLQWFMHKPQEVQRS